MPRPYVEQTGGSDIMAATVQHYFAGHIVTNSQFTSTKAELEVHDRYRTYVGSTTPGYRSIKGKRYKRKLAPLPYMVEYRTANSSLSTHYASGGDGHAFRNIYSHAFLRNYSQPFAFGIDSSIEAGRIALSRLGNKVNKMHINLGQAFAERKQTANLLADTASRIARASLALKRGNVRQVWDSLGVTNHGNIRIADQAARISRTPFDKRVANHWLEFNFGWQPLLGDVFGAAELLASRALGERYHTSVKSSGKAQANHHFTNGLPHVYIDDSSVVRYTVHYRMDSETRQALSQTGISNPWLVAWEIVPYSFVVDWFLPVNNFLKNLMIFDGFEIVEGTKSVLRKGSASKDWSSFQPPGFSLNGETFGGSDSGMSMQTQHRYTRSQLTDWPTPKLTFRNPLENGPLWKFLTSMALMRQTFSGNTRL